MWIKTIPRTSMICGCILLLKLDVNIAKNKIKNVTVLISKLCVFISILLSLLEQ